MCVCVHEQLTCGPRRRRRRLFSRRAFSSWILNAARSTTRHTARTHYVHFRSTGLFITQTIVPSLWCSSTDGHAFPPIFSQQRGGASSRRIRPTYHRRCRRLSPPFFFSPVPLHCRSKDGRGKIDWPLAERLMRQVYWKVQRFPSPKWKSLALATVSHLPTRFPEPFSWETTSIFSEVKISDSYCCR